MGLNSQHLAKAIVLWLELEKVGDRSALFSEFSLRYPVSLHLQSVASEVSYPKSAKKKGASKAIDFAINRRGDRTMSDAIEAKWITSDRNFKQEIFDDILRLEYLTGPNLDKWFLVAGAPLNIESKVFGQKYNPGGKAPRELIFEKVLPHKLGARFNVKCGDDKSPLYQCWKKATESVEYHSSSPKLPSSIDIKLAAKYPVDSGKDFSYEVWIWKINRVSKRAERDLV